MWHVVSSKHMTIEFRSCKYIISSMEMEKYRENTFRKGKHLPSFSKALGACLLVQVLEMDHEVVASSTSPVGSSVIVGF